MIDYAILIFCMLSYALLPLLHWLLTLLDEYEIQPHRMRRVFKRQKVQCAGMVIESKTLRLI